MVDPLCVCRTIFRVTIALILSSQSHEACYYMKRDSHITVFACLDERVFLTPEENTKPQSVTASPVRAPERHDGERPLSFHRWYQRIDSQRPAGNAVMSLSGPVKLSSEEEHQLMQKWQNELGVCSEVIVSNSFTLHLLIRRTFSHQVHCKKIFSEVVLFQTIFGVHFRRKYLKFLLNYFKLFFSTNF